MLVLDMMTENATWSRFTNSQAVVSASGCKWSNDRVASVSGRRFRITRGNLDETTQLFWYSRQLQPRVDQLFWHDATDIVDHLQENKLTIHNLYNHDQIPLGKTLWASSCIFFLVSDLKNRFWKSFNRANQCSEMRSSQRCFTYLFLLSLDNTFEMFRCLEILQTASLIKRKWNIILDPILMYPMFQFFLNTSFDFQ